MGRPSFAAAPAAAVSGGVEREDYWRSFDNSVSAVSFGFVATAILISMFLVMAIFERFLRPPSSDTAAAGLDGGVGNLRKMDYPSLKMSVYAKEISVLMPGEGCLLSSLNRRLHHALPNVSPGPPIRRRRIFSTTALGIMMNK